MFLFLCNLTTQSRDSFWFAQELGFSWGGGWESGPGHRGSTGSKRLGKSGQTTGVSLEQGGKHRTDTGKELAGDGVVTGRGSPLETAQQQTPRPKGSKLPLLLPLGLGVGLSLG